MAKNINAVKLGKLGGQAGTPAQNDARRENWKKAAAVIAKNRAEKKKKKLIDT